MARSITTITVDSVPDDPSTWHEPGGFGEANAAFVEALDELVAEHFPTETAAGQVMVGYGAEWAPHVVTAPPPSA